MKKKDRCNKKLVRYNDHEPLPKPREINSDGKIRRKNRKKNKDKQKASGMIHHNVTKLLKTPTKRKKKKGGKKC